MKQFKNYYELWRKEIKGQKVLGFVLLFFIFSMIAVYVSGNYTTNLENAVSSPDLILDNIRTYNLDFTFAFWPVVVIVCALIYALFFETKKLSYFVFITGFLYIVRS